MNSLGLRIVAAGLACCGAAWMAGAQNASKPAYLDPSLPAEQRAADLVGRMTLEEKATQLVNQARAIPRLNVPAYDWWSEALHGVLHDGTTEFPEPIGLAATFDAPAIHEMAVVIGTEGRIKHVQAVRAGAQQHLRRPGLLGAQHQHLPRSPLGTRPGDLWRRSVPDRAHGRGLCHRHAGRRSALLPRHLHAQALCRAQRAGANPPHRRRDGEQARRTGHLSARLPRHGDRGQGRFRDVRLQQHQRPARLRQRVSASGSAARQVGLQGLRRFRLRRRAQHLRRPPLQAYPGRGFGHQPAARHGQRVRRLLPSRSKTITTTSLISMR